MSPLCSNLVHKMPLGQLFVEQFEYADVFNHLRLNDTETGLVCAVMIFNPGMINTRSHNLSLSSDMDQRNFIFRQAFKDIY